LRDHVNQQRGINSISDPLDLIDGLRRFNEDDICASLTTRFAACYRFLEPHARTGVCTGNDHKVRVAPRRTGRLDLLHKLPPIHYLFAFIVTTTLWRHLILDMDTSGAHCFHLAYGTHQIDGIAIAGVSISQDGYRYRFTDHLDACHLLIQRNESNVWHTCAPGNASTGDINTLETRLLDQYCREPVPCPRQDQNFWRCYKLTQPLPTRCHTLYSSPQPCAHGICCLTRVYVCLPYHRSRMPWTKLLVAPSDGFWLTKKKPSLR